MFSFYLLLLFNYTQCYLLLTQATYTCLHFYVNCLPAKCLTSTSYFLLLSHSFASYLHSYLNMPSSLMSFFYLLLLSHSVTCYPYTVLLVTYTQRYLLLTYDFIFLLISPQSGFWVTPKKGIWGAKVWTIKCIQMHLETNPTTSKIIFQQISG